MPTRPVPLVPEDVLRRQDVFVSTDTRFAAACRLLASLWREEHGLPAGQHRLEPRRAGGRTASSTTPGISRSKSVRLASRLSTAAARAGATFLSPAIAVHAREILLFREPGALFEETRLWGNLLSSQALTLNLFIPLALDPARAAKVFRRLLPGFVGTVTGIRFEHSPGRRGPDYFGDGTAFDLLIDIVTPEGEPAFVVIEVKYTEGAGGPVPAPRPRYTETTRESGLYRDPDAALLARPGFEQLRREHVLSQLMLRHGLYARGHFVLLGPAQNGHVQAMGQRYTAELGDAAEAPGRVGFSTLTLETVVAAIREAGAIDLAASFTARYLDLGRVARFVLTQAMPAPPVPRRLAGKAASAAGPDRANPEQVLEAAASDRARAFNEAATVAPRDDHLVSIR
ncbi:MAG: hypothetical protein K0Q54_3404 [Methylobacterium brachiatum]|jgi:hypothetical protein|nr:hypothetical protein [Methylobacterium brachiatum]